MKNIAIIFLAVGTIMLCLTAFLFVQKQDFLSTAVTAQGQVVQILQTQSGLYKPLVTFTTQDGQLIGVTSDYGSRPPAYEMGEEVTVYYQSRDPKGAEISGFFSLWGTVAIFGGIGSGFVLLGTIFFVLVSDKSRLLAKLKRTGIPVEAKVSSVYLNQSVVFNGQHPFQISAIWTNPQSGEEITFLSVNLWFDPTETLKSDYITVFMDKNNPKRYVMDLTTEYLEASQNHKMAQ